MKNEHLFGRIVRGDASNVRLADLVRLIEALGFVEVSGRGSHRVFAHPGVFEMINLQDGGGGQAKRYQVKQVGAVIRRYDLKVEER